MNYGIRKMKESEYGLLADFLYDAIFVPEGTEAPLREIISRPELQVYIADFGRHRGDHCLGAYVSDEIVGAVWVRIMNDYGHIDDDTPSFAISVHKEYRGQGIGTALMRAMLELLKEEGFKQVSLAVQKENYALKMYKGLGFETVNENEEEYIMVCRL
ncbi:MAG: GNAT family N-acetyltransferase [Oscillospiraceae bacterium]|nr:GNAT family N-acetyltransferase [Oscillospiraceae bacterium]